MNPDPDIFEQTLRMDPMNNVQLAKLLAEVAAYFGGIVTQKQIWTDDELISPPLKNVFREINLGKELEIAVPCGSRAAGLSAVATVDQSVDSLNWLLDLNPALKSAPITRWRGMQFRWVWVSGWCPGSQVNNGLFWLADGYAPVVCTQEYDGLKPFVMPVGQTIPTIDFETLKWPSGLYETFLAERIQFQNGNFLIKATSGKAHLNYQAIALFLARRDDYIFDPFRGGFRHCPFGETDYKPISEAEIARSVNKLFQFISLKNLDEYPAAKIKFGDIKVVINLLRTICAYEPVAENTGLMDFIKDRIEPRPGGTVTSVELYDEYVRYCKIRSVLSYPRKSFFSIISEVIRREFSVLKSHCISRSSSADGKQTARNGFAGIAFKDG